MFHKFPYTNFHELNLDWILKKLKELEIFIKKLSDKVDEAYQYMKDNLYDNAYQIINNFIEEGVLNVAVVYHAENEELDIITSEMEG